MNTPVNAAQAVAEQNQANQTTTQNGQEPAKTEASQFAEQFDALATRERNFYAEKKAFADQKKEFEAHQAKLEEARKDPVKGLEYLGHTEESFNDHLFGKKEAEEKPLTQAEIESIKSKTKEEIFAEMDDKKKQSELKAAEQKAIADFKEEVKALCTPESEYNLIGALGEHDLVYQVIEQDFQQKSQEYGAEMAAQNLMTKQDAAAKVQKVLATELETMFNNNIVQDMFHKFLLNKGQKPPVTGDESTHQSFNTLTNDVTPTGPTGLKSETREQKLARCAGMLREKTE